MHQQHALVEQQDLPAVRRKAHVARQCLVVDRVGDGRQWAVAATVHGEPFGDETVSE
ncbi:MAG TPA: hypothetical protein PL143_20270 [Rhodocyclaceae bacterium]|nr:hypothetical protein [Rhodocyclaceae bacterium]